MQIKKTHPIVQRLKELGVTNKDMAEKTKTHRNNVSNWLAGHYPPHPTKHLPVLNQMLIEAEENFDRKSKIEQFQNKIIELLPKP